MRTEAILDIVIPCYNAEAYINECVTSILNSTFVNFRILLVDDGSTAGSSYLTNISKIDSRIKVILKQNGGVSSARNLALKEVSAEWVTFIDADDFITRTYLEDLMKMHQSFPEVEFIHAGCMNYYSSEKVNIEQKYVKSSNVVLPEELFIKCRGLIISKLFKTEIIKKYGLSFDEKMKVGEDLVFTLRYIALISSGVFSDTTEYYYRRHNGSTTGRPRVNYAQKLYEFNTTKAVVLDCGAKIGLSQTALCGRLAQLGKLLLDTVLDLYRSNTERSERIRALKTDFKPDFFKLINVSSFSLVKKPIALLLRMRLFTLFDFLTSLMISQKK